MTSSYRLPIIAAFSLLLALSISSTFAAKGEGRVNRPLESLEYSLNQLDLTKDQQPKIDDILATAQSKFEEIRKSAKSSKTSGPKDHEALKQKAKNLMDDIQTQVEKVLTPDQSEKLKKLLAEERAERKEDSRRHKRHPATTQSAA